MTSTFTVLEARLLSCLVKECFYEQGFDSALWVDCFFDTLEDNNLPPKIARGVLSSLSQKGALHVQGEGRDSFLTLGEPAKAFLLQKGLVDKRGYRV